MGDLGYSLGKPSTKLGGFVNYGVELGSGFSLGDRFSNLVDNPANNFLIGSLFGDDISSSLGITFKPIILIS